MFEFLIIIFNTFLYRPLFNFLILIYYYLPGHDFGVAIIVLTAVVRLILYPSSVKSIKSQRLLSELQPKIVELQKKYEGNKEKQAKATLELYQKAKVSPFSGCLPTLIQLPILIALYRVFWQGLRTEELVNLYSFIPNPGLIKASFLGFLDLTKPYWVLAIIAGILQFIQTKTMTPLNKNNENKKPNFAIAMQKQMLYIFPVFTVFILLRLPAALGFYWAISSLFSIIQQYFIFKTVRTQ